MAASRRLLALAAVAMMVASGPAAAAAAGADASAGADPWSGAADVGWYSDGESEFEIGTAEQLAGLATLAAEGKDFRGKKIVQSADIDLGGRLWTPISVFDGEFDGNGHKITGMDVSGEFECAGLFGTAGDDSVLTDIFLTGTVSSGSDGEGVNVYLGGIAGYMTGRAVGCTFAGEIGYSGEATVDAGGIAGHAVHNESPLQPAEITGCISLLSIVCECADAEIGGIVGESDVVVVDRCMSQLDGQLEMVRAAGDDPADMIYYKCGGIAGYGGSIKNCSASSRISFQTDISENRFVAIGGIIGTGLSPWIRNCSSTAEINLTGACASTGDSTNAIGGIIGNSTQKVTVQGCYSLAKMEPDNPYDCGGIVGHVFSPSLEHIVVKDSFWLQNDPFIGEVGEPASGSAIEGCGHFDLPSLTCYDESGTEMGVLKDLLNESRGDGEDLLVWGTGTYSDGYPVLYGFGGKTPVKPDFKPTVSSAEALAVDAWLVNNGMAPDDADIELAYTSAGFGMSDLAIWVPIGTMEHPYTGTFDGGNRLIDGLRVFACDSAADNSEDDTVLAGLFGCIVGAEVSNVNIVGGEVVGAVRSEKGFYCMGALAASIVDSTVESCTVLATVLADVGVRTSELTEIGGAVGAAYADDGGESAVRGVDSMSDVIVRACDGFLNVGGVVGGAEDRCTIADSLFSGGIAVSDQADVDHELICIAVGGIVGQTFGECSSSYADGRILAEFADGAAGGIVGILNRSGSVANCRSAMSIVEGAESDERTAGGIAGYILGDECKLTRCYWYSPDSSYPQTPFGRGDGFYVVGCSSYSGDGMVAVDGEQKTLTEALNAGLAEGCRPLVDPYRTKISPVPGVRIVPPGDDLRPGAGYIPFGGKELIVTDPSGYEGGIEGYRAADCPVDVVGADGAVLCSEEAKIFGCVSEDGGWISNAGSLYIVPADASSGGDEPAPSGGGGFSLSDEAQFGAVAILIALFALGYALLRSRD